jgi:penicillin-binding protein 2
VLNPDGTPARDDEGNIAVPDAPRIRGDLRQLVKQADIEVVRRGLWKVVNEPGGTGAKGQIKGTVVAGKTGTAQSHEHGKDENIAWFACFAPYDHPKYVVVAMVQGGKHGGSVAGPVAQHILDQVLAMDQGTYSIQLAALKPADNPHPFNEIAALPDYTEKAPALVAENDESVPSDKAQGDEPQMSHGGGAPDIRASSDAEGNVKAAVHRAATQRPVVPQADRRNILERFFHPNQSNQPTKSQASPAPRRPHWPF